MSLDTSRVEVLPDLIVSVCSDWDGCGWPGKLARGVLRVCKLEEGLGCVFAIMTQSDAYNLKACDGSAMSSTTDSLRSG